MSGAGPARPWYGGKPFPPVGYAEATAANMTANGRAYYGNDEDDEDDDEDADYGGAWVNGEWVAPSSVKPPDHLSPSEVSAVIERHIKREKRNREAQEAAQEAARAEAKHKDDFSAAAAGVLSAASGQSFTTDWAKGAISAAFEAGLAQGRREQMPAPPCKSCMVRKERNRVAARESRRKKSIFDAKNTLYRDAAEYAAKKSSLIKAAADVAASRAAPAPAPKAAAAEAEATGAAEEEDEGELEPPPF
jgi:hypothetical protein